MIAKILIQPFVSWQINRFDHLKAVTNFLRFHGLTPIPPQSATKKLPDDWVEDGEWIVWHCSQPIPVSLIEQHFEFPLEVQLQTDPKTGSAVIACEKSKTAIGFLKTDEDPSIAKKAGVRRKLLIQSSSESNVPCSHLLPLTDLLQANGFKSVFSPNTEELAAEAIKLLARYSSTPVRYVPREVTRDWDHFDNGTRLSAVIETNLRGWLMFEDVQRFSSWHWVCSRSIPLSIIEENFILSPELIIRDRLQGDDWSIFSEAGTCVIRSIDLLRRK